MTLDDDGKAVAIHIVKTLPLESAALTEDYRYRSISLCIINAVFSIGVRYGAVQSVVRRYCEYANLAQFRSSEEFPPVSEQEPLTTFCKRPENADFERMAREVFQNLQRTSTKGGILKAEAVHRFAQCMNNHGINYFQDLPRIVDNVDFEREIRSIPGQRSGISLQYFWMLAGSADLIKPDRMVLRFLTSILNRAVKVEEAQPLLTIACANLISRYPNLSPRLLDYEIWRYQREVKDT